MLNALVKRPPFLSVTGRLGPFVHGQLSRASERFRPAGGDRVRRRPTTSRRRSAPTSGGCTSAPTIIGCRCSTAAIIRRSRTSSRPTSSDFAPNSVLLDFTGGRDNPATPYIGAAIREECGLDDSVQTIADIPSRSLLSRLTDHYLQIIANRAPVGFEAEFVNQRGEPICYRGILMPFSSDGDTIDFIYGVINWKAAGQRDRRRAPSPDASRSSEPIVEPQPRANRSSSRSSSDEMRPQWPRPTEDTSGLGRRPARRREPRRRRSPTAEIAVRVSDDAGLADWLWAAARNRRGGQVRRRPQPRRALPRAGRWPMISRSPRSATRTIMPSCSRNSGVKAQARAPMTPIVKLVFGIDYDKTRLTEFAVGPVLRPAPADRARRVSSTDREQAGGLKALVAAERQARRPEPKPDTRGEAARERLRTAEPLSLQIASERRGILPGRSPAAAPTAARAGRGHRRPGAGRARDPPRRLSGSDSADLGCPCPARASIARGHRGHSAEQARNMTVHTRVAKPLVDSLAQGADQPRAARRNQGLDPRRRARGRRIPRRGRRPPPQGRSRAGDRIDRRRGRPAADAHRHRQRRHAVPGRFGRQRDRRPPADHPPPAPPGACA